MKRERATACGILAAHLFAVVALFLAAPPACVAQGGVGSVPASTVVDPEAARIRDEKQREIQLRNLEAEAKPRANEKAVKAALDQLNQDFTRIQIIRNDIARAVKVEGNLDYRRVSDEAAEVKKRALRMQGYLALRGPGADVKDQAGPVEYDDRQIKIALVNLCRRIDSFVANPKFTSPLVADVGGTASAARDLREIIDLSASIRGSAEKLGRKK